MRDGDGTLSQTIILRAAAQRLHYLYVSSVYLADGVSVYVILELLVRALDMLSTGVRYACAAACT